MSGADVDRILGQAFGLGFVETIYFEGGEPFLYYPLLRDSVQKASRLGFQVGVVTNGYWATSLEDARSWLTPLAGLLVDLSVSCDQYHAQNQPEERVNWIREAAEGLGLSIGTISIPAPDEEKGGLMYRGRAAETLAPGRAGRPWGTFTRCPYEDFRDPGRVHIDPLGCVHLCQGISIGNIFEQDLGEIFGAYRLEDNPVLRPLAEGGPATLAVSASLALGEREYVDACHFCYRVREALRERYPAILAPDPVYGVFSA